MSKLILHLNRIEQVILQYFKRVIHSKYNESSFSCEEAQTYIEDIFGILFLKNIKMFLVGTCIDFIFIV